MQIHGKNENLSDLRAFMPEFVGLSVQHGQEKEESEKVEILDFSLKVVFLKNVEN